MATRSDYTRPTHTKKSRQAKPVRGAFGYYGAKRRLAGKIIETLPPHNAWVEAFCGSAAMTLVKPPAPIEVINDRDGEIVNLFRQLRNNGDKLCEAIALTPYSREEFMQARSSRAGVDPVERARRFLVASMMGVNGTVGSFGCGFSFSQSYAREGREARVNRWYNLPDRLTGVIERLRGVRVENRDAREIVGMFSNRPATLLYLDPPYLMTRRHGYSVDDNSDEFHSELLTLCTKARCMMMISGYESKLYSDILRSSRGWTRRIIDTDTRDTSGRQHPRREVLWTNERFVAARRRGRVPIRLTAKERSQGKVNPPRQR